jgi:hypothetical protein
LTGLLEFNHQGQNALGRLNPQNSGGLFLSSGAQTVF